MTTKLTIYNGCLQILGERKLASLDDPVDDDTPQSQIELDTAWDNGARDFCLEQALWNFATRSQEITYDPDITPAFGLQRVFEKPSDWIRTAALCSDEKFTSTVLDYRDEGPYWFSDLDTIYVKYISNDSSYGYDLSLWPQTFVKFVSAYLAMETCERITQNRVKRIDLEVKYMERLNNATSKDAFNQANQRPALGAWARSRGGGRNRDGGSRGQLTG